MIGLLGYSKTKRDMSKKNKSTLIAVSALIIGFYIGKNYVKMRENARVSGFFPSNKPIMPSNPGPLMPYGARWGNPHPSPDTNRKATMIT